MRPEGLLIVDPNPVYRDVLAGQLAPHCARRQVTLVAVGCAQDALAILDQQPGYWTVVVDIQMPGLSGLAVIKAFGALASVNQVVCLSALDEKQWGPRTVRAGAVLFLSKHHRANFWCNRCSNCWRRPTAMHRLTGWRKRVMRRASG